MPPNAFIDAARAGRNTAWRYAATVGLVVSLVLMGSTCPALLILIDQSAGSAPAGGAAALLADPIFLALSLFPFVFIPLGLWIGLSALHGRSFFTLINPHWRFDWKRFFLSAGLWLLAAAAADLVLALFQPGNYRPVFEPARFFPYLLVAVLLIPLQASAEELLFRGYLTQGFGLWGGYKAAWLAPSLIFALLHMVNPEVLAYGIGFTLPVYLGLSLLLGWVTLRYQGLEMALGLHLVNNLYGTLVVTSPAAALPSPALLRIQVYDPAAGLLAFAGMAILYLAALRLLKS